MPDGNESPDVAASRSRAEPTAVFTGLADIVYQGSTPAEIYAAICIAATLMVPGCDHASVMLRDNHIATTAAASDSVARKIDKLEQALGEGPCLDAISEETPQIDPDLRAGSQWPALAARVLTETPVHGIMGFRLLVGPHKIGALNLFSDSPNAFDMVASNAQSFWRLSPASPPTPWLKAKMPRHCNAALPATARSAKPSAC